MKIIWYYFADEKKDAQITQDWKTPNQITAFEKAWKVVSKPWKDLLKSEKKYKKEKYDQKDSMKHVYPQRHKLKQSLNEIWEELAESSNQQPASADIDAHSMDEIKDEGRENVKVGGSESNRKYDRDNYQKISSGLTQPGVSHKRGSA